VKKHPCYAAADELPARRGPEVIPVPPDPHNPGGSATPGRIDLYQRRCFVLASNRFKATQGEAFQLELAALVTAATGLRFTFYVLRFMSAFQPAPPPRDRSAPPSRCRVLA